MFVCLYVQRQVADARNLSMAVVESHLLQAQKASQPLDTERAGLSSDLFSNITRILSSPPLSSGSTEILCLHLEKCVIPCIIVICADFGVKN